MVYRAILDGDVHTVSSPAVAEMEKILENTYRNVNIGLVNELAILCNRMGIDIWEVIDAAKTKALRLSGVLSRPRLGRPLHSAGPLLSQLEGPRVRLPHQHDRGEHEGQ